MLPRVTFEVQVGRKHVPVGADVNAGNRLELLDDANAGQREIGVFNPYADLQIPFSVIGVLTKLLFIAIVKERHVGPHLFQTMLAQKPELMEEAAREAVLTLWAWATEPENALTGISLVPP